MIRHGLVMAAVFGIVGAITTSARAESPLVTFDVATALPCKVVSVADDAQRPDARQLVEVVFKISALLESGSETDLSGLTYTISSVREQGQMQVADFLPKTELYTDITEPIVIIESSGKEAAGTLGVNYQLTPSPKTSLTAR